MTRPGNGQAGSSSKLSCSQRAASRRRTHSLTGVSQTILRRLQSGKPPLLVEDGAPTVPILPFVGYRREWNPGRRRYPSPEACRASLSDRAC